MQENPPCWREIPAVRHAVVAVRAGATDEQLASDSL